MKKHIDSISKTSPTKPTTPEVAEKPAETTPVPEPKEAPTTPPAPVSEPAKAEETPSPETKEEAETETTEEPTPEKAQEDSFETLFPEPSVAIAGPPTWIWWTLLIAAAAVLGVIGFSLAQGKISAWISEATPTPSATTTITPTVTASPSTTTETTPSPTPTATPSTSPTDSTVNKATVTLRVLNGTTVNGAASTAKTSLEKAGFTVRTIGNAKNQTYASTMVYYQAGKKAEGEAVQAVLADSYSVTLEESTLANPDNVLVVIGSK